MPRRRRPQAKRPPALLLVGGAMVLVFLGTIALVSLQEDPQELAVAPSASPSASPTLSPTPEPLSSRANVTALKLGMNERQVRKVLGTPDRNLGGGRFRYSALGLEVRFRPSGKLGNLQASFRPEGGAKDSQNEAFEPDMAHLGGALPESGGTAPEALSNQPSARMEVEGSPTGPESILESVQIIGPGAEGKLSGLELSQVFVGASPEALRPLVAEGRVLFDQESRTYTLYLPERALAVDFSNAAITQLRHAYGIPQLFEAASVGPRTLEVQFERVFDPEWYVPPKLSDQQVFSTLRPLPGRAPAHQLDLKLKLDLYEIEDLKEYVRRRIKARVAAGDAAAVVVVYAHNGARVVTCDWYAEGYERMTGKAPVRVGELDLDEGISYRWF